MLTIWANRAVPGIPITSPSSSFRYLPIEMTRSILLPFAPLPPPPAPPSRPFHLPWPPDDYSINAERCLR